MDMVREHREVGVVLKYRNVVLSSVARSWNHLSPLLSIVLVKSTNCCNRSLSCKVKQHCRWFLLSGVGPALLVCGCKILPMEIVEFKLVSSVSTSEGFRTTKLCRCLEVFTNVFGQCFVIS